MATLRPDNSLNEYSFTEEEIKQAKLLNPLQIMWLQTKFALIFKQKAAELIPTSNIDDREFLLSMGKLEGKLEILSELFEECKQAQIAMANPQPQDSNTNLSGTVGAGVSEKVREIAVVAERAANMVHEIKQT